MLGWQFPDSHWLFALQCMPPARRAMQVPPPEHMPPSQPVLGVHASPSAGWSPHV